MEIAHEKPIYLSIYFNNILLMVAKIIPAGSYAVFPAIGEHPKKLIETWGHIWQQADLERTYTGDYEVYGDKFSGSPQEVEVFIAIEIDPNTCKNL